MAHRSAHRRARRYLAAARVRRRGRACFVLLIIVGLGACGSLGQHRVQGGETLYAISFRYGLDYRDVAEWNALKPPYTIYQGQVLRVVPPLGAGGGHIEPGADSSPAPVSVSRPSLPPSPGPTPPSLTRAPSPIPRVPEPPRLAHAPIQWRWPTEGTVVHTYSDADVARKGIDIGGRLGQPVRASAAGRVVYAGKGLLTYGNLVIIKHNDDYLSAYAYNHSLRVKEGEEVVAGQHITDMGSKGHGDALLHFQIRLNGRPVDPLRYLPDLRR